MIDLFNRVSLLSEKAFPDANLSDYLLKLEKEVKELQEYPHDVYEFADCFMCLFSAAHNANISYKSLVAAIAEKLAINEKREWVRLEDGTYQHKG